MNRKDIFTKTLLVFFTISLLFFIYTKLLIVLKNNTYKNADKKIEKLLKEKEKMQNLEKRLEEYKNFGAIYNKIKTDRFFVYKKLSNFREMLQRLRSQYNFLNSSYDFNGKEIFKEYIRIPLSVNLVGSYRDLKKFIFDINKIDKFISINSIKFQKSKSNISGKFSIEVYFVK